MDDLVVTFWPTVERSKDGKVRRMDWAQVAERVRQPTTAMPAGEEPKVWKQTLAVWHAAVFRNGHRTRSSLDVLHGLWLDFDTDPAADAPKRGNLALRYEDIARAFGDVRHLAYTTCSHRPESPRFKVLLPLSRAATLREHARLCEVVLSRAEQRGLHGLDADPSWRQAERGAFVPCHHAHYEGHATPVEVPPLDVDAWLAVADQLEAEAAAATWEDVRPIQPTTCDDPFPVHALPPVVRDAVEACAASFQVPTSLPASLALTILAAAASGRYHVRALSNWEEHLVLWTCIVQRPGTRKSPVFNALMRPLRSHQRELQATAAERRDEVKRERARVKAAKQAAKGDERARLDVELEGLADTPTPFLYVGGDATPEAVAMALDANGGRLLLADDEAVFFQHAAGLYRDGGANIDALLKGWDGSEITVHRKGSRPVCISRALLSVMLTVQPEAVRRTRGDGTLAGRGFLARFLWSLPPDGVGYRDVDAPELDPRAMAQWNARVRALLAAPLPEEPESLTLAQDAWIRFQAYRRERERLKRDGEALATTDALREWASKADGAVLRIAGVLHVASGMGSVISDALVGDAIAIVDHYTAHARCALATFAPDVSTQLAARAVSWLQREATRRTFTVREVHNRLGDGLKAAAVVAAVGVLEERGYVRAVSADDVGGPGRPRSTSYEVNPRWQRR